MCLDTSSRKDRGKTWGSAEFLKRGVKPIGGELVKAGGKPWRVHRPLPLVQAKADHRDF